MAVLEVACPGCGSKLKAPDTMAGKKAKCKKCSASFRIPGGDPQAESAGESQMLSALDTPAAPPAVDDAFNFGAMLNDIAAEEPKPKPKPAAKSVPKAPALPPEPAKKAAAKSAPKSPAPPVIENFEINDGVPESKSEVLSLDDDEEVPTTTAAAAAPADPFAFPSGGDVADAGPGALVRSKPSLEEAPRRGGHTYRAKSQPQATSGKGKLVIGIVALLALGGGIGAAVVMMTKKKDPEPVKKAEEPKKEDTPPEEKKDDKKVKDDKKDTKATKGTTKDDTKKGTTKGKDDKKGSTTPKEPPKDVQVMMGPGAAAVDPGPGSTTLALPANAGAIPLKAIGAKPELFQPPASKSDVDVPFGSLRRVFPSNKVTDGGVVWQSGSGFQGKGEKLTLDMYSPTGRRTDRIEFDGDGRPEPVCDLSPNADHFAHAADGKITVWKVQEKAKAVDKFDPYADKPEHKTAGIGAVYFSADAKTLATVSTAGAVHVWAVPSATLVGEFIPPKGTPGRVSQGKGVAITPERDALALAVGGVVSQVLIGKNVQGQTATDLKGDVGKSLAIATVAGKMIYLFETAEKKEKAVMLIAPDGSSRMLRLPTQTGDPVSAGWADGQMAVVGMANGSAMWFEFDDMKFLPIALIQTTGGKAAHTVGVNAHYAAIPGTAATKTTLLELAMPPEGLVEYRELAETKRTAHTFKLDAAGLAK